MRLSHDCRQNPPQPPFMKGGVCGSLFQGKSPPNFPLFKGMSLFSSSLFKGMSLFSSPLFKGMSLFSSSLFRGMSVFSSPLFKGVSLYRSPLFKGGLGGILVLALTLLSACGWQLRGTVALPASLKAPLMVMAISEPDFERALNVGFIDAGATPVNEESEASIVIEIQNAEYLRKAVAVDSEGRALTYELGLKVQFRFRLPSQKWDDANRGEVVATASFQYDSDQVLSKASEENRLRRQLKEQAATRLLQQLSLKVKSGEN